MSGDKEIAYLFEASWEVCNKVGGIYTVLKTKAGHAVERFGDGYFLIGPDVGNNPEFKESGETFWNEITPELERRGLPCRFGRWDAPGSPRVILVNHHNKYVLEKLLFQLWQDFGIDSMAGAWDYIEPVLYSTAYGEVMEVLYNVLVKDDEPVVAQFHEWMSAAGMFYVKKQVPEIATVFTSHATMLGRSLAGQGVDIYKIMEDISPSEMAVKINIAAKYSMEVASARECDCFTTVSDITAREAEHFLYRKPPVVLPNGINIDEIPDYRNNEEDMMRCRGRLLDFAGRYLQKGIAGGRKTIMMISGRYEFHNKGIDLFLETLGVINKRLKEGKSSDEIIAFFCVIGGHFGVSKDVQRVLQGESLPLSGVSKICTHQLQRPQHDPIWNKCNELNLLNDAGDAVSIIFMPVYLDGFDGLLNMPYYDVVKGCDLCVFPSFYEPWGYTPLESAAFGVPTVTSDLSGFGLWVRQKFGIDTKGVLLLERETRTYEKIGEAFSECMWRCINWPRAEIEEHKNRARSIAEAASWDAFYPLYLQAYGLAARYARDRVYSMDTSEYRREVVYPGTDAMHPRFRHFTVAAEIPDPIKELRNLAYNLLWTWNRDVRDLFIRIDGDLWNEVSCDPIELLERVSQDRLTELAGDESYLELYNRIVTSVVDLMKPSDGYFKKDGIISQEKPVAYFSTEYGLHEILPIYSGGLGILSGDYLKSASNMNISMIGIGLLYKNGYFHQRIDREGNQITTYPENDFSRMPVRIVKGKDGESLKIEVDLPGRKLYAQVWKIDVGMVQLYLLDTEVPENSVQDREITSRLYGADQRLRIEQEIMLGIGGVRLLDALGVRPAIYHLNEGHSAFLLIERVRQLMVSENLSFYEAREMVKASSLFTTHSPVEAANERFDRSLMKHYFSGFVDNLGISWEMFWELGRDEPGEEKPFMMPVLALKLCCGANGVSLLHGRVARRMWKNVWSGFDEKETPIQNITNGVHLQSWIADEMAELFTEAGENRHFPPQDDADFRDTVERIPDATLWATHQVLKKRTLDYCKDKMTRDFQQQGLSPSVIKKKRESLDADALTIGFARRFAAYKRALLLFSDPERLDRILHAAGRPVQIIFAGKAHPNDEEGKRLLRALYSCTLEKRFIDRVFFLENYDMQVAKFLLQGVDVWLNTPVRPQEASGTSGMKGIINGVLNFSVRDGWWDEAFNGINGWCIGDGSEYVNREMQDLLDSQDLYDTLENSIVPLYYRRREDGLPEEWIAMMKESMASLAIQYSTHRMLEEYCHQMYGPIAGRASILSEKGYEKVRALADWKLRIASRFSTVHLKWLNVKGLQGDSLNVGGEFIVEAAVEPGKLTDDEIRAEIVIESSDDNGSREKLTVVIMEKVGWDDREKAIIYRGAFRAERAGRYVYGVRVLPNHPHLIRYQELGLVLWA